MASDPWQLRRWEEIPAWLKNNPFIRSGYRVEYTWSMCFRSLFMVHNETGNVWSHFAGVLLYVALGVHLWISVLDSGFAEHAVFVLFISCCILCLGGSAFYHLTCCRSAGTMAATTRLDYCGISSLVTGSFIPLLYFIFQCHPTLQIIYVASLAVFGGVSLVAPWFHVFHTPEWYSRRIAMYVVTIASGALPAAHAFFILPFNDVTFPLFMGLGVMFSFYGVGVCLYVARIPERWYPGHFDLWFNSHQVWHCFSVAATTIHYFLCIGVYQRWEPMQC